MIDQTPSSTTPPRIALAHDWLCGWRGGEAVLERIALLASGLGELDGLYTMFDDGRALAPTVDALRHEVSALGALPAGWRRWLLPLYPLAVGQLSRRLASRQRRSPVDLLISTSSAAIKGMRTPTGVPHLCYCHAPARYVWSVMSEYTGGMRGAGLRAVSPWYRRWDRATAANVTSFVANSAHTAGEISRCYGREAAVVHPPVRTEFFTPGEGDRGDFWLFVGALEPYKRADLAIAAAGKAGVRLLVAGEGSMGATLRRNHAGEGVEFLGRVPDEHLRSLYRTARLLVFPQVEDFGITAVEAQACGCPVVARRAGGALDSVIEGATGSLFDDASPEAIVRAAESVPADADACRRNAERFGEERFDEAMRMQIRRCLSG